MTQTKNKRKIGVANKLHRNILLLVFFASLFPALIVAVCLYYLIFNITAQQIGFPEGIAYNIIPAAKTVISILSVAAPFSILAILILAFNITHRIVGPFDRILRELDESMEGKRRGSIVLRPNDKFQPLVDRINKLLNKLYKQ